jgi:hypothetical protein
MFKSRYTGVLGQKIEVPLPPERPSYTASYLSEEIKEKYFKDLEKYNHEQSITFYQKQLNKITALYEHYRVSADSPDAKDQLIYLLALNHVPGFQPEFRKRAGRHKAWDDIILLELFVTVDRAITSKSMSRDGTKYTVERVCKHLIKHEPWSSLIKSSSISLPKEKTLQNKYAEAQHTSLVQMYLDSRGKGGIKRHFIDGILEELFKRRERNNP